MKKAIALTLSLVFVLTLAACGAKEKTYDLDASLAAMLEEAPIEEPIELSQEDLLQYFGIEEGDTEEFAAVTCGMGLSADEIVLVKAPDSEAAERVQQHLSDRVEQRKSEFRDYIPEAYDVLEQAVLKTEGNYVFLIVSPSAETLAGLLQESK